MSLRIQLSAALVLASLLPMIALFFLMRRQTVDNARAEYDRRLAATASSAEHRVQERLAASRRVVERACDSDFVIDRLLLDLAAHRFSPTRQQDLVERLPAMMRSLGLDALVLLDAGPGSGEARVLASGHYPGRAGARDAELLAEARRAGERPFVQTTRVRADGEAREVRTLSHACVAERDEVRVLVIGGTLLDQRSTDSLLGDVTPAQLVLTGPDGRIPRDVRAGGGRRDVVTFPDASGAPAARLLAVIDDRPLQDQLGQIDRNAAFVGLLVLVGTFFLAFGLAWRMVRPLAELESAARRVAGGDLDSTIAIRHGGEVGQALVAFNHMTHELRSTRERMLRAERIAAWRDIARRIAHEIKNPLSPIQLSIETMRKTYAKKHPDFDEIFEESTLAILEEVDRLKHIVTEFSRFARLPRPRPESLDVREVAEHVVGLHAGGDVELRIDGDPVPAVRADREQLTQVLVNLVQNACDAARARHGAAGGEVDVRVEPEGAGARVTITDNGPGIPADQRLQVFEPYFTTKPSGTGLGLAIVHRIVGDHGGTIEVEESPSGGASFVVRLPREGPPPEVEASMTDTALPLVIRRPPE